MIIHRNQGKTMIEQPCDKSDDTTDKSGFGPLWSETLIEHSVMESKMTGPIAP